MQKLIAFSSDLAMAKNEFKAAVKALNKVVEKPCITERLEQVNWLIESYVHATEKRPDVFELYSLGSYLLDDYLTDQYKHHRKDEHPFKTDGRVRKNHARNKTVFLGDRTDV